MAQASWVERHRLREAHRHGLITDRELAEEEMIWHALRGNITYAAELAHRRQTTAEFMETLEEVANGMR